MNGYQLVDAVLSKSGNDVGPLIEVVGGHETDWLTFKATIRPEGGVLPAGRNWTTTPEAWLRHCLPLPTVSVASLDALLQRARLAQGLQQPLELLLRIGNDTSDDLFVFERRLLPVEEIDPIGP